MQSWGGKETGGQRVLAIPWEPHLKAMCPGEAQTPEVTVAFPDTPTGHTSHRATVSLSSPGCPRTHHLTTADKLLATLLPQEGLSVSIAKDSKSATACQASLGPRLLTWYPSYNPHLGSGTQAS